MPTSNPNGQARRSADARLAGVSDQTRFPPFEAVLGAEHGDVATHRARVDRNGHGGLSAEAI